MKTKNKKISEIQPGIENYIPTLWENKGLGLNEFGIANSQQEPIAFSKTKGFKRSRHPADICICGHHTKNHSYNPENLDINLKCDLCECEDFKSQRKDKTADKIYLQCGYEDRCKNKDCLNNCSRRRRYNLSLTLAEEIAIEDFAVGDLKSLIEEKDEKEVKLLQDIMQKIMKKVFRQQK